MALAEKIIVAVGSTRKPKLGAVADALREIGPLLNGAAEFAVVGREVPSGVGHTPSTREELMQGARRRARALEELASQENQRWDFFVGLEGGLDSVTENGARRVFLESWAYVSDGARGHFGCSAAIEIPEVLAHEVLANGVELAAAIDRFAGEAGIRDAQGAWGVLSSNRVTRQDSFRVAVIAAFAPFYNSSMYRPAAAAGR